MPYHLFVDDNFHYMDEEERTGPVIFETAEAALAEAKRIVDASLQNLKKPHMSADQLFSAYKSFGDDPFIRSVDAPTVEFSAWDYARSRCQDCCR